MLKNLTLAILAFSCVASFATQLDFDARPSRTASEFDNNLDYAIRQYARNFVQLTKAEVAAMAKQGLRKPASVPPVSVNVIGANRSRVGPKVRGDITLQFDASGARAFPTTYRDFLIAVFAAAKPSMNLFFGNAFESGTVKVRNYDADIGDRDAVAGGVYVHNNGSGEREIRFPIYQDGSGIKPEVTAVNFIHTLLLAYQGGMPDFGDAWNDGMVRAGVTRVVRTPGALPNGLDAGLVEDVIDSSYGIGGLYDWNNQPALSSFRFVAPNLVAEPLPAGGSLGGLYLLRYNMASTAWQKVLVQYPTFFSNFRRLLFDGGLNQNFNQLVNVGQSALNEFGGVGTLIEDQSFSGWVRKQYVLDNRITPGPKLALQPFPIVDGLSGSDWGVFGIQAHYFDVKANGNEELLRTTGYPVYWSPDYTRFFTSAQDDRMDIQQGYGSVAPNFPDSFGQKEYRVTVDLPIQDQVARVELPAGSIASARFPTVRNVFGTLTGVPPTSGFISGVTYSIGIYSSSSSHIVYATYNAFSAKIDGLALNSSILIEVRREEAGQSTLLLRRRVNKTSELLALRLDINPVQEQTVQFGPGIGVIVPKLHPYRTGPFAPLGLDPGEALFGRWNGLRGVFDLDTQVGSFAPGRAVFGRSDVAQSRLVTGNAPGAEPIAIALRPGWNFVGTPFGSRTLFSQIDVVTQTNAIQSWNEAVGNVLGSSAFEFLPGAAEPPSNVPETGTFRVAADFPASGGVYVRCLAPEGAMLLFTPDSGRSGSQAAWPAGTLHWLSKVELRDSLGNVAFGEYGQGVGATRGFDTKIDSGLPPQMNGSLSVAVETGFRDIRPFGPADEWKVTLQNLKPGREYRLNFSGTHNVPITDLRDTETGKRVRFSRSGSYRFIARSATKTLRLASRKVKF